MATPMVAATGALIRHLNPDLTAAEIVRLHQGDRAPPRRRVDRRPGLGDPRRGRRADPRREHRPPRAGLAGQAAAGAHGASRTITVRWSAADKAPAGVRASGIARFELWRATDGGPLQAPALDDPHLAPGHPAPRRPLPLLHASRSTTPATASRRPSRPTRGSQRRALGRSPARRSASRRCSRARASSSASDASMPSAIVVDVGQRVVVAEQAEVHAPVVGHDRDGQRVVLGQEGDREDVEQLAPAHVERELRARGRWSRSG